MKIIVVLFFFSSRRRHTRCYRDWSSDVCSSDLLQKMAERMRGDGVRVRTHVVVAHQPAVAILEEASNGHADLIALETHGRNELFRLLMGSVADKVVRG